MDVIIYREAARRPSIIRPLTDVLIGLRCLAALMGYGLMIVLALLGGAGRGPVVAITGLILVPSALVTDVGLRASRPARLDRPGARVRSAGLRGLCGEFGPESRRPPPSGLVPRFRRGGWTLVPWVWHCCRLGWPRVQFRQRAWIVVARRRAIAGVTRFGQVSLYGADLLVLGWWAARSSARMPRRVGSSLGLWPWALSCRPPWLPRSPGNGRAGPVPPGA